jgi:hypothetical protein
MTVGISEDLQDFVSSLTYASFHDYDEAAAPDTSSPLEPWQVKHATAILKRCPELENLRYVLCPKCAPHPEWACCAVHAPAGLLAHSTCALRIGCHATWLLSVSSLRGAMTALCHCCSECEVSWLGHKCGAARRHSDPLHACYRRMTETKFWAIYFRLVRDLIDAAPPPPAAAPARPAAGLSHGKSHHTTPSAMSAWEDVEAPSVEGSHDHQAAAAAQPEPPGDDLDEYLKV